MVAPYFAKYDALKARQAALWAEQAADKKRRFAPLAAAWRAKAAKLASR